MKKAKTYTLQKTTAPVFIGSKGRPNFPLSKLLIGAYLIVEKEEYQIYKNIYGNFYNFLILPESNKGPAYMLNFMLKSAKELGFEYYMYCDDDLLGFMEAHETLNIRNGQVSIDKVFAEGVDLMKENNYSQLGMGFIGHNFYRKDKITGMKTFEKKEIIELTGPWAMFIARAQDLIDVGGYDEPLGIFIDYEISARLLKNGYKTATWYKYMFDHKMKSLSGGSSDVYGKIEKLNIARNMLLKSYGSEIIKLVDSHNQPEVRFNFRKCWKSSL